MVQALAAQVNAQLGNLGATLWHGEEIAPRPDNASSLADLMQDIDNGAVDTLIVLDANPAYAAPGELAFADHIGRVRETIHAGLHHDETAALCRWHVPLTHALESWSDARAVDGTTTIIQPVVAPFYSVRSVHQVMDMMLGAIDPPADHPVRATWMDYFGGVLDQRWRQALHDGFIAHTAVAPVIVSA